MLNWSYTVAVFTPPGSTTDAHGYSALPTHGAPAATSFTVKSNGELRFCKKCQARKPDRAHHCSTCRRCVLKMDHHCPWLATCVGLRNHKAFLLFLVYTSLFSLYGFAVAGDWVYNEILNNTTYVEDLMPVNFIMLCIVAGIIGLVVGAFTIWHLVLVGRGQTTIECLEKTRYLSPLRQTLRNAYDAQHGGHGISLPRYGQQLLELHENVLPGITRPEEGEDRRPAPAASYNGSTYSDVPGPEGQMGRRMTYDELERHRARKRYEEYLDEQDSAKLPNAFDLGVRRNYLHLFGHNPWLWPFPIFTTTGDGWSWEPNPRWLQARDDLARERERQRQRERAAGWGHPDDDDDNNNNGPAPWNQTIAPPPPGGVGSAGGAGRHYVQQQQQRYQQQQHPQPASPGFRVPSKADRVLGRDPNLYDDIVQPTSVSMRRLRPSGGYDDLMNEDDLMRDDDEDKAVLEEDFAAPAAAAAAAAATSRGQPQAKRSPGLRSDPTWGRGGASGLLREGGRGLKSPGASGRARGDSDAGGVD